ncbi:MAG: heavy-metal-associated domain-containing protein [Vicinamibacterales bacterium]
MSALTLTVTGMTCGGCENAVKRALSMMDGVDHVTASHGENRVELDYDPAKVQVPAIRQKIEALGYQVQG